MAAKSSEYLSRQDVEAVVGILGAIAGMTEPLNERRRALVSGISRLIGSDIWMWIHSRIDPATNFPSAFRVMDGGWKSDGERNDFLTALHAPEINAAVISKQVVATHHTTLRQELLSEEDPRERLLLDRWTDLCGMRESITSVYMLDGRCFSGLGFHRRSGATPFTDRDRCIVHLITSQIDWLHRAETDVPANTDTLLELTRRQREVLLHLMAGDSRKQIAHRLGLSTHTVADYMKGIYKHFDVSSQPELLSLFMAGRRR